MVRTNLVPHLSSTIVEQSAHFSFLGMLAFYGPSVFTVGLDDWPRHRKAVAAPFSETLMNMVWNETLRLTQ